MTPVWSAVGTKSVVGEELLMVNTEAVDIIIRGIRDLYGAYEISMLTDDARQIIYCEFCASKPDSYPARLHVSTASLLPHFLYLDLDHNVRMFLGFNIFSEELKVHSQVSTEKKSQSWLSVELHAV